MPEETSTASSSVGMDEKPCSSSVVDSSIDVTEEAKKLIGTGNRHLVMGDVVSAVNVFQEACGMLAARYGDTAEECGEAFFLCGKSLLELARMENTVLGNALEGVPQSDEEEKPVSENIESANNLDEDTRDKLRRQVYEAMAADKKPEDSEPTAESKVAAGLECGSAVAEPLEGHGSGEGPGSPAGVVEPAVGAEMKGKEVEQIPVAPATGEGDLSAANESADNDEKVFDEDEEKSAESGEDDDDDDEDEEEANADDAEDEDVGNLQLAWEMLEVAKFIYKRKESKEDQLMAAQAYLKLGEVSVESGNYPQALEDFQECLTLQLKHLPPSSRLLAESNYHVAQTLCYMDAYSQAIEHYNRSIEVIENRLAVLQKVIDTAEGADGAAKEKTEQEELRQLLPDVTEKVADAKESQRAARLAIRQALDGASTSSGFSAENGGPSSSSSSSAFASASQISTRPFEGASSSKSTSDISHLVRKKRKTDEESLVKDADAKQPKQESTVNGSSSSSSANGKGLQEKEPAETSASKSSE
ncbi:nuclear autoantigenic sperm protein isoform X1 [Gadus macrocephalus]|uniref:nuclear autoantigenic sperm protein isoform X1 n=1 Tax=Gadus macrocephalus TaxID=80720 RepID=UPI0028CB6C49|nr:nuclear autoantigenic sperm protein isoform X1 [Gadus macrocephalus]